MPYSELAKLNPGTESTTRRRVSISDIAKILGTNKNQHSMGIPTYEELDELVKGYLRREQSHKR